MSIQTLSPLLNASGDLIGEAALDGARDDTNALQRALDQHEMVYIPRGHLRIDGTLRIPCLAESTPL